MKKMAEIMEDLGFRPEASDDVKRAFVKNLIKQAQASEFKGKRTPDAPPGGESSEKDPDQYVQISLFDQKISS